MFWWMMLSIAIGSLTSTIAYAFGISYTQSVIAGLVVNAAIMIAVLGPTF